MSQFLLDDFSGSGALNSAIWQTPSVLFFAGDTALAQAGGVVAPTLATAGTTFQGEVQGTVVPPNADYNIKLEGVNFVTTGTGHGGVYIGLRYHDAGGFPSFFYVILDRDNGWLVEKIDDSGSSPWDPPGNSGSLPSPPFDAELRAIGPVVTLFLNGVSTYSFTDSGFGPVLSAIGRPYLALYNSAGSASTSSTQVSHAEANSFAGNFWTDYVKTAEF